MKLSLYTNRVAGGWTPVDKMLSGSEDSVVCLSTEFAKLGWEVEVFLNAPATVGGADLECNGVLYRQHKHFTPSDSRDVLITFKDKLPLILGAKADTKIHWTAEVETPWAQGILGMVDKFVTISHYHSSRLEDWVPADKLKAIPLGVDTPEKLNNQRMENWMLYSSSPDRGLAELLRDWPEIRKHHPDLELIVTYGWERFDACGGAQAYKQMVQGMMDQPGVHNQGQVSKVEMDALYNRAQYWVLPLQFADSELFCFNAMKARIGGAMPVVNRIGALQNTVESWIPYDQFCRGETVELFESSEKVYQPQSWGEVVADYWLPMFTQKRESSQ